MSQFHTTQAKHFDSYTKNIDTLDLDHPLKAEQIEFEYLLGFFDNLKDKSLLDLGCGTGRVGLKLAPYAKEVVGIDVSKNSIAIANKTAKKYKINNFKGIVDDFNEVKYKGKFDYIIAVNMLHHTDDIDKILQNIKIALKKDGVFLIFEFNPLNLLFLPFLYMGGQLQSHLTKEYVRSNIMTLTGILRRNKFSSVKVHKYALLPTMLYNHSLVFKKLNEILNKIPIVKAFAAFHIIECSDFK